MIFSKPVVGLAVGGVGDVVADGVNGILLKQDDPAQLAEAISGLIKDPQVRSRMGAAGRDLYEEKFQMQTMIDACETYFITVARL